MKVPLLFVCLLVAPLALALSACREEQVREEHIRPVKSLIATARPPEALTLPAGTVQAHLELGAAFRISGKIKTRFVSVGDRVRKGQKLAVLDDAVQRDTLTAARADVEAAKAVLAQSRKQTERVNRLVRQRAVSQNEQEVAERQFKAAQAQLESAQAQGHAAEEQLGYTVLYASADGLITARLAESGEVVAAGQAVFRIAGQEGRDAVFDAPESLLSRLKNGALLRVCLDSSPETCSPATIYEISPQADSLTRTYQIKALMQQPGRMPLGATLTGSLPAPEEATVLPVPASALGDLDGKPILWILEPASSTVSARPVTVSNYTKDSVLIQSGLQAGEIVVTAGVHNLRQGQKVRRMDSNGQP